MQHTLLIDVRGWAWGGFEATYRASVSLPAVPDRAAVRAFAERLLTGAANAELGTVKPGAPAERVDFGDFQSLSDCKITLVSKDHTGGRVSRDVTETRTLRGWKDRTSETMARRAFG